MSKFLMGCVLVFLSILANSQSLSFEHLSQNDGLPSPTITVAFKDSYGFMWFGTRRGLVKYDGYEFTVFDDIRDRNGEKITNFFFRNIVQTDDSTLFLSNNSTGFYSFNLRTQKFTLHFNDSKSADPQSSNVVLCLFKDKSNMIWLGTQFGLVSFDPKSHSFANYPLSGYPEFARYKHAQNVSAILQDDHGDLWMFCQNGYVATFDMDNKKFRFIQYSKAPESFNPPHHGGNIVFDKDKKLWIGTEFEGIYAYDIVNKTFNHYSKENGKLPSNIVMGFCEDASGALWVASDGGGLLKYNPRNNGFDILKNDPADPNSLSGNAVYTIYQTDDHILWIGTYAAGINMYKSGKQKFRKVTGQGVLGKRLSYKSVLSFAEASDGSVLVATDGGGLNVFDPISGNIKYFNSTNSELHSNVLNTVYFDHHGFLWVGSYDKGLCRYSFKKGSLKRSGKVYLEGKGVWNVLEDAHQTLWIGSLNVIYSIQLTPKGEIFSAPKVRNAAPIGVTNAMVLDSQNELWIGTSSLGLFKFDQKSQRFSNLKSNKSNPKALPSNNVTSILEDDQKNIWIGTEYDGISKLISFERNEFLKFPNPSNHFRAINSLLKDKAGTIWMSTDNGIVQFSQQKAFNYFSLEDGLQNKEFNINASMISSRGEMYFGGTEGFNCFRPEAIPFNNKSPKIYITDLKLFNHKLEENVPFQGQVYLKQPAYLASEITLNYEDNVFAITFSALDYLSPSQNFYQYKLEGFDKDWFAVEANKRSVTYTNLPPGDFVFQVKGANSDGVWSKGMAKLIIHVLPPWWMTWWFRGMLWLVGISSLLTFYFWRTHSIKKRNQELKELVEIKTSELKNANDSLHEINEEMLVTNERLEAQNLEVSRKSDRILEQQNKIIAQNAELNTLNETKDKFFSIIAHDLRNPVSALHAMAGQLNQNFKSFPDSEKEQYVRMMLDSTTNLKKLTLDLLDWATSQTRHYLIDLKPVNVQESIGKTILALSSQAQQKNILLDHPATPPVWALADAKMIETVIRNLTSNAIKYSPNGSVVSIYSELAENGFVKITVADHGVGMSDVQSKNLFSLEKVESTLGTQNEKGVGLGLIICKEFVALNNGRIEVESEISKGTQVHVYLPLSEETSEIILPAAVKIEEKEPGLIPAFPLPQNPEIAAFTNRKLLIIDDEPSARKVLRGYLGEYFEIYEAENGVKGLEMAQNVFPEIIICDLNMPVMNGFEFCSQLKSDSATSHIACIILTGQTEEDVEKRSIVAGADEFLTKPYDAEILIKRIINQLHTRDQVRRQFSDETDFNIKSIAKDKTTQAFLEKTVAYIESRLSDSALHADDLCKELGLSKTLLYEKIKNLSGLTVNEFIKVIRLKHSLELLKQGEMTVSQIAFEVGFNSLSYYTRSFTKQFGKAPSEFLKG